MSISPIHVIGGGLAGSEAAWQVAQAGVPVVLHEMRPVRGTDAHQTDRLAELVCSNSFRADDWESSAVGLLHAEMRRCGSLILAAGDAHQVPAGGALAVDRDGFAAAVTARIEAHPLVTIAREEVAGLPPAGTWCLSPQAMINEFSWRISACSRPTALYSQSSERNELEQTSSARLSVLWASVPRTGRIS